MLIPLSRRGHRRAPASGAPAALAMLALLLARPPDGRADTTVVFNEIMYHPAQGEARLEWVELYNQLAVDMDLSGWYLDGGIRFPFPDGTVLPGGGFLVVASSPETLLATTTVPSPVLGPFEGRLDNSGERLELRNNNQRLLDHLRYRDRAAWPVAADGAGVSLAKRDPDLSSPPARSWTVSAQVGGTPGDHNFPSRGGPARYPAGLVAYWSFDQTGGQFLDLAGSNNGSPGSGTARVAGLVGSGAIFLDNTSNAFVSVGTGIDDSFTMSEGIAVEALIEPLWSALGGDPDTIYRKEDGPWRVSLAFQADGISSNRDVPLSPSEQPVLSFGIHVGGVYSELDMPLDGREGRPSLADLKDGAAHHVAATYDSATGLKAIYFDGALAFSFSFAPGTLMRSGGTTTAYIGNMSGRRQPFHGLLDEVAIYKRSLSAREIASHHANFRAGRSYFERSAAEGETLPLAFNEYAAASSGESWVELVNSGPEPVPLAGVALALSGHGDPEHPLGEATLPAGGFLLLWSADLGFPLSIGDKLFLYPPGKGSVLDGLSIEADHRARYPEATGRWIFTATPTPGLPNQFQLHDEIVINEILYHGRPVWDGSALRESPQAWIELFNRGGRAVDLTGWRLDDAVEFAFEDGTLLAPGEYLVVAADRASLRARYPAIRIAGDFQKHLSHKEDEIVLRDAAGNIADEVHYFDGGYWPRYADGGGSSLELRDPRADNDRAEAWAASIEETRSEWKSYRYRAIAQANVGPTQWNELVLGLLNEGEALIDDVSVVEAPGGSARQLLQNGDFEAGESSWRFLGTHRSSRVIPNPDGSGRVLHLVATGATEHMHNHVETTYRSGLRVTNGREYEISFRARWLGGSNLLNTRLYFNRLARTTRLDVPLLAGTPGARNSTFEENIGPTFEGLSHEPAVPAAGEEISVAVEASDPDGVAAVTLWWNVAGTGWRSAPMTRAESGRYEGTIPGQSGSTIIQYYVEATDGAGASAAFPAAGRDSRVLLQTQDGQSRLGKLHNVRIIMLPADADFLHRETNVMSNEWLPSTVVYDERTVYPDVGVRLKGSERGRPVSGRVGFHLKFHPDRLFRGVHPTLHVDRSGGWKFGGPSGQDEILIKHIVNHAGGIPGMYDDIVHTIAPRAAQNGPALLLMAAFNDHYLDSQWENGSDGAMYKLELIYYPTTTVGGSPEGLKRPQPDRVTGTDLRDLGDDKEAYRWTFLMENNKDLDDYSGLIALSKAFSLPSARLEEGTRAVMDVDEWMRTFAVYSLCGITDTYTQGNNHNNLYYRRPSDGKMLVFPWDMDFAWVRPVNAPLWGDQNLSRIIQLPANRRLFYSHLLDITDTTYNRAYMSRWTAHYGSLAGEDYSSLLSYMDQRRSYVRSRIPARVPFAITTNGGAAFTVNAVSATLEGTGWFDVREIVEAGASRPLEVTWTGLDHWKADVDLDYGPNDLQLLASNLQGGLVGSDRITVTSSFGWKAPRINTIDPARGFAGNLITVTGSSFQPGIKVFFGGEPSPRVIRDGDTSLRAEVPDMAPAETWLAVRNPDGRQSPPAAFAVLTTGRFVRGDANLDGLVDLSDAVSILLHLFAGEPLSCPDAGDANDDEVLSITDAIDLLRYLFRGGPAPPSPFPAAGADPDGAALGCRGRASF